MPSINKIRTEPHGRLPPLQGKYNVVRPPPICMDMTCDSYAPRLPAPLPDIDTLHQSRIISLAAPSAPSNDISTLRDKHGFVIPTDEEVIAGDKVSLLESCAKLRYQLGKLDDIGCKLTVPNNTREPTPVLRTPRQITFIGSRWATLLRRRNSGRELKKQGVVKQYQVANRRQEYLSSISEKAVNMSLGHRYKMDSAALDEEREQEEKRWESILKRVKLLRRKQYDEKQKNIDDKAERFQRIRKKSMEVKKKNEGEESVTSSKRTALASDGRRATSTSDGRRATLNSNSRKKTVTKPVDDKQILDSANDSNYVNRLKKERNKHSKLRGADMNF